MIKDNKPTEYYETLTRENAEKVLKAEAEGAPIVPALPIRFTFELTADCNLHCPMCQFNRDRSKAKAQGHQFFTLPFERFEEIAQHAFPTSWEINPTVVGEPLLIPYLDALIDSLKHYWTFMEIITNGMLLQGEVVRKLMPVLSKVTISFDGATAKTFERIRVGSDFQQIVKNIREFSRLRDKMELEHVPELIFGVTLMKENIHELPDIVSLAAELEVDYVSAANLIVFQEKQRASSLFFDIENANSWLERARERAQDLDLPVGLPKPFPTDRSVSPPGREEKDTFFERVKDTAGILCEEKRKEKDGKQRPSAHASESVSKESGRDKKKKKTPLVPVPKHPDGLNWYCRFLWREAFISLNGDVSPCCIQGRPAVGNAFREDFMQIWNGKVYQAMRKRLASGTPFSCCRKCTVNAEMGNIEYDPSSFLVLDSNEEEK